MTSFNFSLRRRIWPVFLFMIFSASAAMAGVPGKPLEFAAAVISNNPPTVKLSWKANNNGPEITGYRVYAASGATEDLSQFRLILETHETHAEYSDKYSTMTFFVRAYNSNGESERTPIKVVKFNEEQSKIKFLTSPKTAAGTHQSYVYEARAQYMDTREIIRYKIVIAPDTNMRIQEETGRVTWFTPSAPGKYLVVIRAYLESNPDIYTDQEWKIIVGENASDELRFFTTAPHNGYVGKNWVYEARAKYAKEPNAIIIYSMVDGPDGMEIDSRTGKVTWMPQREGLYIVVIRARVDGKPDMQVDQKFEVLIGGQSGIGFVSVPGSKACVGKDYFYMPIIASANPAQITFSLLESPDGMTVNEKTGLIRWTPSVEGEFPVVLSAEIMSSGATTRINQSWNIKVRTTGCDEVVTLCTRITGQVLDQNGDSVTNGWVVAIRSDNGNGRFKGEIKGGLYSIYVPEGTFVLNVGGDGIIPEWYQDAENIKTATRITTKCGEISTANMTVQRREPPTMYTVTGRVTNEAGVGVPAVVRFTVREQNGLDNKEKSMQFMALTNEDGTYLIRLADNFSNYVASATPKSDKYIRMYFDNTPNPQEATLINLNSDREINFVLPERTELHNGFSGKLINQDGGSVIGSVIAIRIAQPGDVFRPEHMSVFTETNLEGNFTLTNLIPGKYVVLGIPATRDWAPGFYRLNELATLNWKKASRIEVGETMLSQNILIQLPKVSGRNGGGHIQGIVRAGNGAIKGDNAQGAAEPLAGALIVAYDEKGLIADYGFSAADGSYKLVETGAGTFNVTLSKPNYDDATFTTAIDYSSNPVSNANDLALTPTSTTGVYEDASIFGTVIYPNPVSGLATLRFNGMAGNCTISIVNAVGAAVQSFAATAVAGENNLVLDLGNIESGVYFVRISNGTAIFATPITIAR